MPSTPIPGHPSPRSPLQRRGVARRQVWIVCVAGALLAPALFAAVEARHPSVSRAGATPAAIAPAAEIEGVPKGARILFRSQGSSVEREYLSAISGEDLRGVLVRALDSPEARHYGVRETPTLLTTGEDGSETARATGGTEVIRALTTRPPAPAATGTCPVRQRRLRWVEETDPRARRVYHRFAKGEPPDIFKAMSLRP